MTNVWQKLKEASTRSGEPIMVLAPMADVTDAAFRRVIAKYGKPDVIWTEFVSADGLIRATSKGKKKLLRDLLYDESERPIIAQLFSGKPEYMYQAAKLVREMGFDGLDINMGCPDKGIEKQGAGAAMIKNPRRAREVLRAAMAGVADGGEPIPVSVKTRLGFNKNELETWLPELLAEKPALITVHARTRKEMSKVPARWDQIKRAVQIRDEIQRDLSKNEQTLIFGNGDVKDLSDARVKAKETGVDGVMLGKAIFGNPWLFSGNLRNTSLLAAELAHTNSLKQSSLAQTSVPAISTEQRLLVMVEHTQLFEKLLGDIKNFAIMKKHFKAYVTSFDGAGELRTKLMETINAKEVENIVSEFLNLKKASK